MSNSVRPHRRQPTRLPHPWDSPGKNTGVGCHFLPQCVKSESEVTQSRPTFSDPMDCSLPGSSVHGIFQARVLEWGAIAFSIIRPSQDWGKRKKLVFLPVNEGIQLCQINIGLRITWRQGKYIGKVLEMLIVHQIHRLT